jgi:hypothetical protein
VLKKVLGNSWLVLAAAVLAAGTGYLVLNFRRNSAPPVLPVQEISPTPAFDGASGETEPTPEPVTITHYSGPTGGPVRGRITCNYLIPAAPGSQGTARLDADWDNLAAGKNGKAEADVCVGVNGASPGLMSAILQKSGKTSVDAPWISLNAHYDFILTDQRGGDLPGCGGTILSACSIDTN